MKKLILYLLVLSPFLQAQNALDPPREIKLYPPNNLLLTDQNRQRNNDNQWILNAAINHDATTSNNFTSLLLIEQLKSLDKSTPFHVSHNATLERFIRVYLKNRKESLGKLLGKSQYYFPLFEQYLDKYELPLELKYLAVVESALNPSAVSSSGAKGLWQFMYGTGREYELYIDSYIDERYDIIKSTKAACEYLQKLHTIFKDWDLALAAYNSGPGSVQKAIRRAGGNTNYWEIRHFLPAETRSYVPAFYATLYLFSYASYHNLQAIKSDIYYYETDTVHINRKLSFNSIRKHVNIEDELLKSLNPQYKKEVIPLVPEKEMILTLPYNLMPLFIEKEDLIYDKDQRSPTKPNIRGVISVTAGNSHLVQDGDNLQNIAKKHNISIHQLMKWNGLQTNFLIAGQRLVVTNKKHDVTPMPKKAIPTSGNNLRFYQVKEGDTLFKISRKLGNISIAQLRLWNDLENTSYLRPGMKLKIQVTKSANL